MLKRLKSGLRNIVLASAVAFAGLLPQGCSTNSTSPSLENSVDSSEIEAVQTQKEKEKIEYYVAPRIGLNIPGKTDSGTDVELSGKIGVAGGFMYDNHIGCELGVSYQTQEAVIELVGGPDREDTTEITGIDFNVIGNLFKKNNIDLYTLVGYNYSFGKIKEHIPADPPVLEVNETHRFDGQTINFGIGANIKRLGRGNLDIRLVWKKATNYFLGVDDQTDIIVSYTISK